MPAKVPPGEIKNTLVALNLSGIPKQLKWIQYQLPLWAALSGLGASALTAHSMRRALQHAPDQLIQDLVLRPETMGGAALGALAGGLTGGSTSGILTGALLGGIVGRALLPQLLARLG